MPLYWTEGTQNPSTFGSQNLAKKSYGYLALRREPHKDLLTKNLNCREPLKIYHAALIWTNVCFIKSLPTAELARAAALKVY